MMRSNELRYMREKMGLTQNEMANAMGMSLSSYQRWEQKVGGTERIVKQTYELAARYLNWDRSHYHYFINYDGKPARVEGGIQEAQTMGYYKGLWDASTRVQFWHEPKAPEALTQAQRQLARGAYDRWVSAGHPDPRNMEGSIALLIEHLWAAFENGRRMVPGPAMPMAGEKYANFPQFDTSWFKA